jgi:hypothetical protein
MFNKLNFVLFVFLFAFMACRTESSTTLPDTGMEAEADASLARADATTQPDVAQAPAQTTQPSESSTPVTETTDQPETPAPTQD